LRRRQLRNFLATLLFSQGVPMIVGGDEFARTQKGNNNAYCQDNEISWFNWEWSDEQRQLKEFTARLINLRREHPVFRRPKFFLGRTIRGQGLKDIMWLDTDGTEMADEDWSSPQVKCVAMILSGDTMDVRDAHGELIRDDTFMLMFNAYHGPITFMLAGRENVTWERILDTTDEAGFLETPTSHAAGEEIELPPRALALLRLSKGSQEEARTASWKRRQVRQPAQPPKPPKPNPLQVDPTTVTPPTRI
jgi:glycogen operon protein